ncbi:hypothetical protein M8J77_011690 [Diaphorina citri]|nr:hypothetical protein M8J77_011690 [Diaphorina citri]
MIIIIMKNSRLDHTYFKGASDPIPPAPTPLPSPYKSTSPLSTNVNGLSNKYPPHVGASTPGKQAPPPPPASSVHTPLLPILNQLPNSKSVFGIARPTSPPTPSLPHSASYLVPQHPLIPPLSPHHMLSLNPRLKKDLHQGRHSESSCDEEREPDPQGEDTETAPENDAEEEEEVRHQGKGGSKMPKEPKEPPKPVPESTPPGGAVDDSVTRCVCGFLHDDGYMICCDTCFVWQHVDCMEIDRQNIPDEYLCEECKPRKVDKMKAIGIQIQKIKRLTDKTVRDNDDDANSDSSHSSQERSRPRGGAGKRKSATNKGKPRGKRASNTATGNTGVRRRKSSGPPSALSPGVHITPPGPGKGKKSTGPNASHPLNPPLNNILHSNNKRKMITVAEKKQNHKSNNGSGKVLSPLNHHKVTLNERLGDKKNHSVVKRMGRKQQEKKLLNNNNNHKRKNSSLLLNTEARSLGSGSHDPAAKNKEALIPSGAGGSLGPGRGSGPTREDTSSDEEDSKPMTRWIDNYEEATCNYYAPDLRARIATIKMNGSHQDVKLPSSLLSTTGQKCRASLLSSGTKILVTSTNMSTNQALIEMRGKYLLATGDRKNVPSPGQHVFFYTMQHEGIDIVIDCKTYGNDARFVRRSCKPNALMKHCIDKGSIHIYLTALYSIAKNSEVTVSYSSGGNPDLCTCGDKNTCTAAEQKAKMYSERKHAAASSAATATDIAPEPVISPKVEVKPPPPAVKSPSPPPVTAPPVEEKVDVKKDESEDEKEEEAKEEEKPQVPAAPLLTTPAKKEKESKPVVSTTSEKVKKQEEKRKSTSDNETTTSTSTTEATTGVKKETDSEKKPTGVTPASSVQKRKKSIQKRKYSESSQSLGESEGNNTEEDEEDKAGGKVSTRRSSTSVSKTPGKKEPATSSTTTPTNTPTKLSREERKLEAIMKAFERMEKSANRQKESRVRKDSTTNEKQEDSTAPAAAVVKNKPQPAQAAKTKRIVRKRKGRSKSFSISSSSARSRRAATRGTQGQKEEESSSGGEEDEEQESSDNSLPLNSVQTPPPSFKLPFSKKGPEDSNQDPESPEKPAGGCAKKRWLRQAISEECESPRSDSPTPLGESAGPLKKRRLARCSLSSDDKNFTPPTTPVPDDDTSTPPLDTAPTLTPKTAYACLVSVLSQFSILQYTSQSTPNDPLPPSVSTETAPKNVQSKPEQLTTQTEADRSKTLPADNVAETSLAPVPVPTLVKPSTTSNTELTPSVTNPTPVSNLPPVTQSIPVSNLPPVTSHLPSTPIERESKDPRLSEPLLPNTVTPGLLPSTGLLPPRRVPPTTLDVTIPLLLPPRLSTVPHLETPQALESSLQNSTDFSMPNTTAVLPPSPYYMSAWPSGPGAPSSTVPVPSEETFTPPPPAPPVKEKLITKRKLSISEYRQRKGTSLTSTSASSGVPTSASLSSPSLSSSLLTDSDEESARPCSKLFKEGRTSPPTSSSSDDEGELRHASVNVGATRVIEKSVMVDNLIAKISKSADSLAENKEFKDPLFTRVPKSPNLINNNQTTVNKKPKPDSFLERPKENLLERLNREFNIRIHEGPPLILPKPTPPLPPGVMPPAPVVVTSPPMEYEDLTSDLYIPIASRSHTPRSLVHKK